MKNKKVILFIYTTISILIITYISYFVFISQKERIKYSIKKTLIYNIENKLNCKICIDKIEGPFFNRIILNKINIVNVTNNSIINIEKIVLKYSLWNYLSKKNEGLRVYEVELYCPHICLTKDKAQGWNWKNFLNFERYYSKECPKVVIKNGLLRIIDPLYNINITLKKINLLLSPKANSLPFVFNSVLGEKGEESLRLIGNIDRLYPLMTNFRLIFNDISIKKFENLLQNYVEKINAGHLSGEVIGLLNKTNQGKYYLSYKGRCELNKGNFKLHRLQDFVEGVSLECNFRKGLLDKKNLQFLPSQICFNLQEAFYKRVPFSGSIKENPFFTKVNLSFFRITLQNLNKILNLNTKPLIFERIKEIQGNLIIEAQHKKEKDFWQGGINYQDLIISGEGSLPSISTKFKYKDHKVDLFDLSWERGAFLSGEIDLRKISSLKINLQFKEMSLKNTLKAFKLNSPKYFQYLKLNGYINIVGNFLNGHINIGENFNKLRYENLLKFD
ncbi:MAG: hypothetical protein QMD92_03995, partial [bacterium]|nr:hypothetical protein [bacterium]